MTVVWRVPKWSLPWIWALVGGIACGGSAFLALALVGTLDLLVIHSQPGTLTHGLDLSAWLILWAVLSMIGVLLATVLAGQAVRLQPTTVPVTLTGVVLSAAFQLSLQQWAAGRQIDYAHDLIGFTMIVPEWVIAIALSLFALDQAPSPIRPVVRFAGLGCVVAMLLIIGSNLRGIEDGIGPDSWLLAVLLMLIVAYALVAAIHLVRRVPSSP
jgi:hypothetical protein